VTAYVLVHAPMVGPTTWRLVADELLGLGHLAIVPSLAGRAWQGTPIWKHHVDAVVEALGSMRGAVVVGHSGAGPLLPLIAERADVAGAIFVDAFTKQTGPFPASFARRPGRAGRGVIPSWADDGTLQPLIPDDELRQRCLDEIEGLPEEYFSEIVPSPRGTQLRSAYVLFSEVYRRTADEMRSRGIAVRELPGGHFHMLVQPRAVSDALVAITAELAGPRPMAVGR
jgi:alpha/beta hydrolase family protein